MCLLDFKGRGGSLRVRGPDPGMPICSSSLLYQTLISFPLPQLLDVSEIHCALSAWLSAARAWEMRSCGRSVRGSQEESGVWATAKLRLLFYGHLHLCLWGGGIWGCWTDSAVAHTKPGKGSPRSCCLPTPCHSHPGASNLCWEIRRTHPRRWREADRGGTTAPALCPENTGYLWKTCLSLKSASGKWDLGVTEAASFWNPVLLSTQAHKRRGLPWWGGSAVTTAPVPCCSQLPGFPESQPGLGPARQKKRSFLSTARSVLWPLKTWRLDTCSQQPVLLKQKRKGWV